MIRCLRLNFSHLYRAEQSHTAHNVVEIKHVQIDYDFDLHVNSLRKDVSVRRTSFGKNQQVPL